jgi:hypothetical protein
MPGHVQRRQAPPGVGHERHRVNREVLVVEMTAHHPQRKLWAGFPRAQAVPRQPAPLAATGPRTPRNPFHRPDIALDHDVRRAEKGARPSSHPRSVAKCIALRGFAHRCSRKVQARRSPQLLTSCGLHLLGPSERRPNGPQPSRRLPRRRPDTATAQLKNESGCPHLRIPIRLQGRCGPQISAIDPATRTPNRCHWDCNVTTRDAAPRPLGFLDR